MGLDIDNLVVREIYKLTPTTTRPTLRQLLHMVGGINSPNLDLPIDVVLSSEGFVATRTITNITIDKRAKVITIMIELPDPS